MTRAVSATGLPAGEQKAAAVEAMFDTIAPRYDLVNRLMTFGLDVGWRRRTVTALGLPPASKVLDLACGTGDLCREIDRRRQWAVGLDFSQGMLASARTRSPLVRGDAMQIPLRDSAVDGITSGFALRNFADLRTCFAECARVLRPGGRIALLEVSRPGGVAMRTGHALYFGRVVPLIGRLLSDPAAYRYLPRSVAYLPEPDELRAMLRDAGFSSVQTRELSGGIAQIISGTRR